MSIILYVFVSVFGFIILLVALFLIVVLCLWFKTNRSLRNQLKNLTNVSFKQTNLNNRYCCTGDVRVTSNIEGDDEEEAVSRNGFTTELAESYVDSIEETFKFAKRDEVIIKVLRVRLRERREIFNIDSANTQIQTGNGIPSTLAITVAENPGIPGSPQHSAATPHIQEEARSGQESSPRRPPTLEISETAPSLVENTTAAGSAGTLGTSPTSSEPVRAGGESLDLDTVTRSRSPDSPEHENSLDTAV